MNLIKTMGTLGYGETPKADETPSMEPHKIDETPGCKCKCECECECECTGHIDSPTEEPADESKSSE